MTTSPTTPPRLSAASVHSPQCRAIGGGPGHDRCICYCHHTLDRTVTVASVQAIIDARLAEAADSIRGGKADAGRDQCAREWAAQQVGYYALSAIHDDVLGRMDPWPAEVRAATLTAAEADAAALRAGLWQALGQQWEHDLNCGIDPLITNPGCTCGVQRLADELWSLLPVDYEPDATPSVGAEGVSWECPELSGGHNWTEGGCIGCGAPPPAAEPRGER